jgi:hypothetical protein
MSISLVMLLIGAGWEIYGNAEILRPISVGALIGFLAAQLLTPRLLETR